jgi:hypothetical protein
MMQKSGIWMRAAVGSALAGRGREFGLAFAAAHLVLAGMLRHRAAALKVA